MVVLVRMRRFSEVLIFGSIYAFMLCSESCFTSDDDPLNHVNFTNISGHFDFRYNASNLSDSSLWVILTWDIDTAGAEIDGILYKYSDDVVDVRPRFRPPGPPILSTEVCDGVDDVIWGVNESTGASVQCKVPCEGIMGEQCPYGGVCQHLKDGFKSISRERRELELPLRFGHREIVRLRAYDDWKATGDETKIELGPLFCSHELITKHGFSEEVADEFCSEHQDIDETAYSSGQVSNLRIAEARRDMESNRGVVVIEWQEPHDIAPGAFISYYSTFFNTGEPDKGKVYAWDKDKYDNYRVTVRDILFEDVMEGQILPILNNSNCIECQPSGKEKLITYSFTDIDACEGDNTTAPYCHIKENCEDLNRTSVIAANCFCPPGFDGNAISTNFSHGTGCYDHDSCVSENVTCDPNAMCIDLPPPIYGVNCTCPEQFIGDGYRDGTGCREESLIIGLAVGIPAAAVIVLVVFAISLKVWIERRRKIEEKMSHFQTLHGVDYTPSAYTISNVHVHPSFGEKYELDRNAIELNGIIGRGNFGVVQKAFYKSEDELKLVAVKMTTENASEQLKCAFLSEISMIIQCGKHENLIGMIGCCTIGDDPIYMVSEYMEYGDLLHFLWKAREERSAELDSIYNLTEYNIYHISSQVACGLKHLVDVKIIHGDIAARNILVGEGLKCKISDFGLANDVYRYGMIKGAAEKTVPLKWISPERMMAGKVPITWRSDVWSFGVLLYEAITLGSAPHPGVDGEELFERLKSGYRMEKPDYCSHYLYDVMMKCWQWSPSKRPSFKQLTEDLQSRTAGGDETYPNLAAVVPSIERQSSLGVPARNGFHTNGHANGIV